MKLPLLIISVGVILLLGCTKPPDYDPIPQIEFSGLSKNAMVQDQFNTDSLRIRFNFQDGDGDIGDEGELNLFLTDLRTGFEAERYRIPKIPVEGASNGVSGEMSVLLFTTCCIYDNNVPPCTPTTSDVDTVRYSLFITDRAGNKSNVIETEDIFLICQ